MQHWPINPLTCPITVGRQRELEAIGAFLTEPSPYGLLLTGETGIGKSRLATEASAMAETEGFLVLASGCFEQDKSLPYGPLVDLLRGLLRNRSPEDLLKPLGSLGHDVRRLLPELENVHLDTPFASEPDPEQQRHRLFQGLLSLLTGLADTQPVLVIVEDLHWSDEASLRFFLYLLRRTRSPRVRLLATCRDDAIQDFLSEFLYSLHREHLATRLDLKALSIGDIDAMIRATLGINASLSSGCLSNVYSLTEGIPYFIEEVLKSAESSSNVPSTPETIENRLCDDLVVPHGIAHLVRSRLEGLSQAAKDLATVAAVAGRRFDFPLLQEVMDLEEGQLLDLVKELVSSQLVTEESGDRFGFRHGLTREAILERLLTRERSALHRRIGEALERQLQGRADTGTWDIAYHFYQALHWQKALEYSIQAGAKALELHSPRAAVEHFTRAIASANALPDQTVPNLHNLHCRRAGAYQTLGEFDNARRDFESVLNMADSPADRGHEWLALIGLGSLWAARDYQQAGALFGRALELAKHLGDQAKVGHTLNRLGNWYLNVGRPQAALRHHRQALEVFKELGNKEGFAETLDLSGMTSYLRGDTVNSLEYYTQAIDLFRELDDRHGLISALATRFAISNGYLCDTVPCVDIGLDEAVLEGQRALEMAKSIGWRSGEAYAMLNLAALLGPCGRYTQALEMASGSYQIASEIDHRQWMCGSNLVLGATYRDLLAFSHAEACLEQSISLAREMGSMFWLHSAAGHLASAYVRQAMLDKAALVLDEYEIEGSDHTVAARILLRAQAELALARKEAGRAFEVVEQLVATTPNQHLGIPWALLLLRGEANELAGRHQEAEQDLESARVAATRQGLMSALWRIHLSRGKFYRALGRRSDSRREFLAARTVINDIAAELPDETLRNAFLQQASLRIPPASPSERATREASGGLSRRELDVARLVAQGMTNRQIAQILVIGDRTVESHVSNIMSKLGFNNRAQIISWALDKGMADDSV